MINILKNYFKTKDNVSLAILFGSFAKNKENDSSDIDIAVHFQKPSIGSQIEIQNELSSIFNREVDVLDLQKLDGIILSKIIENGIKIKNNSRLFAYYNLKVIYFNQDFLPAVSMIQKAKRERFINGL